MVSPIFGIITLFPLGVSALVFLYHTLKNRSAHRSILSNFNLLMSFFMGGWFITELFEVVAPPPIQEESHYLHFAIMVIFALGITWRWRWANRSSKIEHVANLKRTMETS